MNDKNQKIYQKVIEALIKNGIQLSIQADNGRTTIDITLEEALQILEEQTTLNLLTQKKEAFIQDHQDCDNEKSWFEQLR